MVQRQWRIAVQPSGPIVLHGPNAKPSDAPTAIVLPVIGWPDADALYRENLDITKFRLQIPDVDQTTITKLAESDRIRVIYDGLGIRQERAEHLIWLNGYLPLKTTPIDRALPQAGGTAPQLTVWLEGLA